ncbi:MAG: prolyl oligopeptidase family serine peptidase [Vulcanimicrobiaceae bacterium]
MAWIIAVASSFYLPGSARPLQVTDARRIVNLAEPAISPDGRRVAVVAISADYAHATYVHRLLVVSVPSGRLTTLVQGLDVSVPRWSPDGSRLGYIARGSNGKMQLFVRDSGARTRQLSRAGGDVNDFEWRPDGGAVAFSAYDARSRADYFEAGNNDYTATAPAAPVHLWIAGAPGNVRRLTRGTWTVAPTDAGGIFTSSFSWSRDGRDIVYARIPTTQSGEDEYSSLYRVNVATGRTTKLTTHTKLEIAPQYAPSGSKFVYSYALNGDYLSENTIRLFDGKSDTRISQALDRNIGGALWLPGGNSLLLCGDDGPHTRTWLLSLHGSVRALALGRLNMVCDSYSSSTFDAGIAASAAKSGAIAFLATTPEHPRELYYLPSLGRTPLRLTHLNDFVDKLVIGDMRQFAWNGPDGFRETGVVTYPPSMIKARRYPIVLLIHGGPGLASIDEFAYEQWPLAQLIASRGYIVLQPNYRGSDDSGNTYMRAIAGDTVVGPSRDIMAGLDAVKRLPNADPSRVAVSGWSYGGLLTSWLITQSHDWKAAISGAAVNDETAEYDLSVTNVQNKYYLGVSPHVGDGSRIYSEQSPVTYAQHVTTPTLIWGTTGDAIVPIPLSYAFFHALRDNHVPVKFVVFNAPTHGPSTPVNQEELTLLWLQWLAQHL